MKTSTIAAVANVPAENRKPADDPKVAAKDARKAKRTPVTPPGLPPLPDLPKTKKIKPSHPCFCGCGTLTKATYAPGHDGYVHGWAVRVERKIVTMADVPEVTRPAVKAVLKARAEKAAKKAAPATKTA